AEIEARKFVLVRSGLRNELVENPVVERSMHLEFEGANRVGDSFDIIAQTMRIIVHRIDAPRVASAMMGGMPDAIKRWVPQMNVRRQHVNLRPQRARAIRKITGAHPA